MPGKKKSANIGEVAENSYSKVEKARDMLALKNKHIEDRDKILSENSAKRRAFEEAVSTEVLNTLAA